MADRFVSGGTAEEPPERDEEWLAAQKELDSKAQQRRQAESNQGSGLQEGGKTLYETLQANKAAKQDAFEESAKLKNQFRSLDDDEIDFLDEVLDSTRKKEQQVKRDTAEQLKAFRRQRQEAEKAETTEEPDADENEENVLIWRAGPKKRKKGQAESKGGKNVAKLRKMSSNAGEQHGKTAEKDQAASSDMLNPNEITPRPPPDHGTSSKATTSQPSTSTSPPPIKSGLGLDAYSSDDD